MEKKYSRKTFLEFLGWGVTGTYLMPSLLVAANKNTGQGVLPIKGIMPSSEDRLILSEGLQYDILVRWQDPISSKDRFGFNNDYITFLPDEKDPVNEGLLWVNHEYINPLFVSNYEGKGKRSEEQIRKELYEVGGSLFRVRKDDNGAWKLVQDDASNMRLHGGTEIPFHWDHPIMNSSSAIGTLANCSGGFTPWGTILTCEENYDMFYGERNEKNGKIELSRYDVGWHEYYDYPPEHYGWVVELDPRTQKAQKLVALGRCAHECATVAPLKDGRVVVYTADDKNDECLYKFISSKPGSLKEGTLYVANMKKGRWESLDYESQKELKKNFKDQTDVLIRLRKAARCVNGSLLDRPEDIEIDPISGHVLVTLTNNVPKGNYFGSILKIIEKDNNPESLSFEHSTFLAGGEETGFACPDNMAFDKAGNLWFASDISGSKMNKKPYETFKNNGLFVVPGKGEQAGQVIQVASAPNDAELTGPFFSPDGKTLFLSVQHPGERSRSLQDLTSHWPEGGRRIPRSAVVTISGPLIDRLQDL